MHRSLGAGPARGRAGGLCPQALGSRCLRISVYCHPQALSPLRYKLLMLDLEGDALLECVWRRAAHGVAHDLSSRAGC